MMELLNHYHKLRGLGAFFFVQSADESREFDDIESNGISGIISDLAVAADRIKEEINHIRHQV
jgi:hypothetical protein